MFTAINILLCLVSFFSACSAIAKISSHLSAEIFTSVANVCICIAIMALSCREVPDSKVYTIYFFITLAILVVQAYMLLNCIIKTVLERIETAYKELQELRFSFFLQEKEGR